MAYDSKVAMMITGLRGVCVWRIIPKGMVEGFVIYCNPDHFNYLFMQIEEKKLHYQYALI